MSEEEKDQLDEQQDTSGTEDEQQDDPSQVDPGQDNTGQDDPEQGPDESEGGTQPTPDGGEEQPTLDPAGQSPDPADTQPPTPPGGDEPEKGDEPKEEKSESAGKDEAELGLTDERDEPQKLAYIRASLTRYSRVMGPGGQAVAQGNGKREQENLYRTLITALMLPENLFEDGIELVLAFFREFRGGAYREQMLHRFANELSLREQQIKAYRGLVTLFSAAADPQMRGHALTRMVDIEKLVDRMPNNEVAARLLAYFDAD